MIKINLKIYNKHLKYKSMYMYFKQIYTHLFVHLYIISYIATIEYELSSHIFFPFISLIKLVITFL